MPKNSSKFRVRVIDPRTRKTIEVRFFKVKKKAQAFISDKKHHPYKGNHRPSRRYEMRRVKRGN